jgi:hypothetical protein
MPSDAEFIDPMWQASSSGQSIGILRSAGYLLVLDDFDRCKISYRP